MFHRLVSHDLQQYNKTTDAFRLFYLQEIDTIGNSKENTRRKAK